MSTSSPQPVDLTDRRFARFEAIDWWDQATLKNGKVLVVGAGALGNEVIKNLALLGVGNLAIADMDTVERSNLTRSVLFREADAGLPKAECAARSAKSLYPDIHAIPVVGNVLAELGLGLFRWADVVVGALDNREARVFVNAACARVGRVWIDGGIEVMDGIVRGFAPPKSACYECTMGKVDWALLNKRRSCSLLARRALAEGGTPTTPTTASVIGGIQAQEVVKHLHGLDALAGRGFVFEGRGHNSYSVEYSIHPDCPWHEPVPNIVAPESLSSASSLRDVWSFASTELGGLDALDLSREIVRQAECPSCGRITPVFLPADSVSESHILCAECGEEGIPDYLHSIENDNELLKKRASELGLPKWDIIWARRGETLLGVELAGDREVMT